MIFMICRDVRTGGPHDSSSDPEYKYQVPDIEVEIREGPFYHGSGDIDDPSGCDVSGGARVCDDIPKFDPETGKETGELLFRAGQIIELTSCELSEAEEQALDEAREAAIPEYSPD